ncbi:CDP-glycerol glycerophosphotransferase family protein [Pullulanibacillus sp. KACC 23026]|uniref:CDP-glycerol glycerophosphotransferase family protein n=1 Tax=Pullulanibacillus sp. KACC 23026 TaxID=3028315 RepID=UPI0023B0BD7D|nr:CDP-glycerol glycerophosphotransferase family protein [Pullulanibacillus sp. KACC 23026]WEG13144.1 CDP-glycerol glycerophosphotransferase family protein [Pullulanibacillus sp. KACC 23026]
MIRRVKRVVRRLIGRKPPTTTQTNVFKRTGSMLEDDVNVVIRKDRIEETLPLIEEMVGKESQVIPHRKVTLLYWNGPILEIEGYYYLEGVEMNNEDLVKKRLVLINSEFEKIELALVDIPVDQLQSPEELPEKYKWAGFKGKFNLSTLDGGKPLPQGEYKAYLRVEVQVFGKSIYHRLFPLGNIEHFLKEGFHTAKMEYFSARRELRYNLLAVYNKETKTLMIKSNKLKDIDPQEFDTARLEKRGFVYRVLYTPLFQMAYRIFCMLPIKPRKLLFASDSRSEISGNFKFVYDEMRERGINFDYKFMLKRHIREKKSLKELMTLAYHLATARFIVIDDFFPMVYPLKIRPKADLVQLWHAVGAFKTFGFSRIGLPGGPSPRSKNHRNYTKAIVSSKSVAKYYAEGFGISEDKIIPTGIPRTDVFFDRSYQNQVREDLYKHYPFLKGKKVITFAPTFRGNGQQSAHYPMEVLDLGKLYHALKDEYVFLFKIHPFVKNDFSIPYEYSDFFYDFSEYREINDLLFVTDILITDYSSVCFEFALLNRPMIFYAYDVEEYVEKRDFYYDYHKFIPGTLTRSTDDLIQVIHEERFNMQRIKPFVNYFFDYVDGESTSRVIDEIFLGLEPEEEVLSKKD